MSDIVVRNVEVEGRHVDVRIRERAVVLVAPQIQPRPADEVVDGIRGVLLPGLRDHHLHLLAMSAARRSVDCTHGLDVLRAAPGEGWVRGVAATQSVDRHALDQLVPDRPVRVQHASGGLWMLNSLALAQVLHVLDDSPDVERDASGQPTGRLWRYDARLRPALPATVTATDLIEVAAQLRAFGVTEVTDATPDLDETARTLLASAPLAVTMLGDPDAGTPWKLHLRDHDLPTFSELRAAVVAQRARDRGVAIHCVTRESLLLALAVLDDVGRHPADRIEHAAVVPVAGQLTGLTVVTQPGFIAAHGDRYLRDVDPADVAHLYPWASLVKAGVRVLPSSDAPYGPVDPWLVMRAARDRRTSAGRELGAEEKVDVASVLGGYLCDERGRRRRVQPGLTGPVVLMEGGWDEVIMDPDAQRVVRVLGLPGQAA